MSMKRVLSTMLPGSVIALSCLVQLRALADDALLIGDVSRGKTLYQSCEACHSVDQNDVGPKHRGVVGRLAGSVSDYVYSDALKKSGITWTETTLNRWLIDPSAMVSGTKMFFRIDSAQSRADIIAFLKEQTTAK